MIGLPLRLSLPADRKRSSETLDRSCESANMSMRYCCSLRCMRLTAAGEILARSFFLQCQQRLQKG